MKEHSNKDGRIVEPRPRILVAGMGNILLRDDGVGVHAVKGFPPAANGEYRVVEVGCAVFDALDHFDWAERILLIDAMRAGRAPGTVYRVDSLADMDTGTMAASLHEFSVIQALGMIQKNPMPAVTIIGVEPEVIDFGLELSEAVEASLPLVWETCQEVARKWIRDYEGWAADVSHELMGMETVCVKRNAGCRP